MPLKKDINETTLIKNQCLELFSSKNIFYNCGADLIEKYKKLYKKEQVKKIVENNELIETANIFFNNNLNITKASKIAYLHRNTLVYRIEKIQQELGLDIRNFNEAVVFENLLIFYNLIKDNLY